MTSSSLVGSCYFELDVVRRRKVSGLKVFEGNEVVEFVGVLDMG